MPEEEQDVHFGKWVDIDQNFAVVWVPRRRLALDSTSVYLYEHISSGWKNVARFTIDDPQQPPGPTRYTVAIENKRILVLNIPRCTAMNGYLHHNQRCQPGSSWSRIAPV